jgi:hypothetical protein
MLLDHVREQRQSHGIVLHQCKMGDRRRQATGVPLLRHSADRIRRHRPAPVDHQVQVEIRFRVVLLDVEFVLASVEFPVEMPQIVPLQIRPMRGELQREADVRAAVQAVQETIDDRVRDQAQVFQRGEELGIDQLPCRGL